VIVVRLTRPGEAEARNPGSGRSPDDKGINMDMPSSLSWPRLAGALVAAMVIAWADAWAQPAPTAAARQTIDCGAALAERNTCAADTSSGAVLVRQSGERGCVLGRTWGFESQGVWVADGCRGTFAFTDDRATVTCSAVAGAREVCPANTAAGVALVSGLPACVLGRTWGYDGNGIWVSDGCQATFVLTTRGGLACGSDGARQHCAADTSAGVVLTRLTITSPCVLGDSWGYDATGVWVDKSCRAEFVLGDPRPVGPETEDVDAFFGRLEPYGRLRGHVAWFNDELEVQDDASFLGLNFSTRGKVKFFATTEWAVSLVKGGQVFNAGATTSGGGFPTLEDPQAGQVFGNRLGNVGIDFGPGGRIAVGKQWAVHTDVTLYTTDQFVVFGSQGSATYTAGTDGGFLGSGRADQTVTYHNTVFKVVRLGGQLQFRTADNSKAVDGAGLSGELTFLPGVRIGAAYTKRFFDDETIASIRGLRGDAEFGAVGARINWKVLEAAVVYAKQNNGDLARVPLAGNFEQAIAFDADGVEALLRFNVPRFSVYGGYIYYRPDTADPLLDPDFNTKYGIAGLTVGIMPNMYAYVESRVFNDSVDAQGQEGFDVLAIGVHYGFTVKGFHRR
jgi:predicted porin